jgi:hypothetical protein
MSTHKAASNLNELKIAIPTDWPWPGQTVLRVRAWLVGRSAPTIGARHVMSCKGPG